MRKYFSIIALIIMMMSCENQFKAEYYFPENSAGFYAIIFNSKNGVATQKQNGKNEYYFEKTNILYAKESPIIGVGKNYYYLLSEDKAIKKEGIESQN